MLHIGSPVGGYYGDKVETVKIWVEREYSRAALSCYYLSKEGVVNMKISRFMAKYLLLLSLLFCADHLFIIVVSILSLITTT